MPVYLHGLGPGSLRCIWNERVNIFEVAPILFWLGPLVCYRLHEPFKWFRPQISCGATSLGPLGFLNVLLNNALWEEPFE